MMFAVLLVPIGYNWDRARRDAWQINLTFVKEIRNMRLATKLGEFIGYFSEAAAKIFGTDHDNYPKSGIQPYDGKIDHKK